MYFSLAGRFLQNMQREGSSFGNGMADDAPWQREGETAVTRADTCNLTKYLWVSHGTYILGDKLIPRDNARPFVLAITRRVLRGRLDGPDLLRFRPGGVRLRSGHPATPRGSRSRARCMRERHSAGRFGCIIPTISSRARIASRGEPLTGMSTS